MEPLVSVIMCTNRPEPSWVMMLECLSRQKFTDFEYVIVDGLFDKRKDKVKKILKHYSFPITYVKDKPWRHSEEERLGTRPGIASARNMGVIHARGKLLVIQDDNTRVPRDWLSRHVKVFEAGFDGMAGMQDRLYDAEGLRKYGEHYFVEGKEPDGRCIPCHSQNKVCNHVINMGNHAMIMDNKTLIKDYRRDYEGNVIKVTDFDSGKNVNYNILPVGWLYCCNCSIRTEYVLKINGFPEEFCGQMGCEDSFVDVCLQRAGAKLLLDKECAIIHINYDDHVDFNDMFKFKNKEAMLLDGKMYFSNEKFVEDLLVKNTSHFYNNTHFNLREMRNKKLKEMYS